MNVTVGIETMLPYVGLDLVKGQVKPSGCLGEIWNMLAENQNLNCRYTIYGTGNRADVVLQGATGHDPRAIQLAFVSSWYDIHLERSQAAIILLSYLKNWSPLHWYSMGGMTILYIFSLFIMLKIVNRYFPNTKLQPERKDFFHRNWRHTLMKTQRMRVHDEGSFGNCVVAGIALVSNQGAPVQNHTGPVRLVILSFLIFGMIMASAYSAMLVSQLTAGRSGNVFSADIDTMGICVRLNSLPYQSGEISHKKIRVGGTCAYALCDGRAALETPELLGYAKNPCTIVSLGKRQFQFKLAIGLMPNSPIGLSEALQLTFSKMRERGLTSRYHRKWIKRPELFSTQRNIHEITFSQVSGLFFAYFVVTILSVVLLMLEISFKNHFIYF